MNETYCTAAFNHIHIDTAGRYRLCCYAPSFSTAIRAKQVLPFDYFFSSKMKSIRKDMIEGKKIPECNHCYKLEKQGIDSPRLWRYNDREPGKFPTEVQQHSIELKLRIFGNMCNLSCYMCVPRNSSTRIKEMEAIGKHEVFGMEKILYSEVTISNDRYEEMVEHLIKYHKYIKSFVILGGEPFIMPRVKDFLNRIPNPDGKIGLTINTNLAQITWLPEIYKKYPRLFLIVSCDHYRDKLAWIRYPIKVDKFENNLRKAKKMSFRMIITCTVSRLNAPDLRQIFEYYADNFNIDVSFNILYHPSHLSAKQFPYEQKSLILGDLKKWINESNKSINFNRWQVEQIIKSIRQKREPKLEPIFYDYIDKLDKHRGTNARKLFGNFI